MYILVGHSCEMFTLFLLAVECPELEAPVNGTVSLPGDRVYPGEATYECADGFELSGATTLKCEIEGEWSENAPVCEAETTEPPDNGRGHADMSRTEDLCNTNLFWSVPSITGVKDLNFTSYVHIMYHELNCLLFVELMFLSVVLQVVEVEASPMPS